MKIKFFLLFLVTAVCFSTCKKSDFEYQDEYERSYRAWLDFKAATSDSYRYEVAGVPLPAPRARWMRFTALPVMSG
jgi:hypothetical protein